MVCIWPEVWICTKGEAVETRWGKCVCVRWMSSNIFIFPINIFMYWGASGFLCVFQALIPLSASLDDNAGGRILREITQTHVLSNWLPVEHTCEALSFMSFQGKFGGKCSMWRFVSVRIPQTESLIVVHFDPDSSLLRGVCVVHFWLKNDW